MKRNILLNFLLPIILLIPGVSFAEKGEKILGVAGGYISTNNSGYAKLYFQYSFSRHVRIAPDIDYVFKHNGKSAYGVNADIHFPFRVSKGIHLYPLAGVGFSSWSVDGSDNVSRFGFNVGGGMDLYITSNLKVNVQGKYNLVHSMKGAYIDVGFGYVF
ncbi:MAG: porin family protein [Muribaculaceae bacterium]|nr:porin family protein [Muribaculaceae bacterium]